MRTYTSIFIGLIALLLPLTIQADPDPGTIKEINFAATDWAPFSIGKKPPFKGIDIDIAEAIAKELGFKLNIIYCPFKRCLKEMEQGRLDLQSGIAFNDQRAKYLDYIKQPYGQVSVAFYVRKNQAHILKSYDDLNNLSIGQVASSHYFEPFNSDATLSKTTVHRENMLLRMLDRNRLDTIIGTNPNLDYEILKEGYKGKFEIASFAPQKNVDLYFAISKKSPLTILKKQIYDLLQLFEENGTLEQIRDKYR